MCDETPNYKVLADNVRDCINLLNGAQAEAAKAGLSFIVGLGERRLPNYYGREPPAGYKTYQPVTIGSLTITTTQKF